MLKNIITYNWYVGYLAVTAGNIISHQSQFWNAGKKIYPAFHCQSTWVCTDTVPAVTWFPCALYWWFHVYIYIPHTGMFCTQSPEGRNSIDVNMMFSLCNENI